MVKMGISTVSSKNALENMMIELPHCDFDRVKKNAEQKWENELAKIKIKTKDKKKKRVFYTACLLYTSPSPRD